MITLGRGLICKGSPLSPAVTFRETCKPRREEPRGIRFAPNHTQLLLTPTVRPHLGGVFGGRRCSFALWTPLKVTPMPTLTFRKDLLTRTTPSGRLFSAWPRRGRAFLKGLAESQVAQRAWDRRGCEAGKDWVPLRLAHLGGTTEWKSRAGWDGGTGERP